MKSTSIPECIKNKQMVNLFTYMNYLIDTQDFTFDHIENPLIRNELSYWANNGGYCIYMSILFIAVATNSGLLQKQDIHYYQGVYEYRGNRDLVLLIPAFERQLGLHAWLCINNSVVDLTANQHASTFDGAISKLPIVIGEYNPNYKLTGFKETPTTIDWYMNKFSQFQHMSVDEWITYHCQQVQLYVAANNLNTVIS